MKTFKGEIYVEACHENMSRKYLVMFTDENGYSRLAKYRTKKEASERAEKFTKDLELGKLLKPDKSVEID